jgi:hypothetical protein
LTRTRAEKRGELRAHGNHLQSIDATQWPALTKESQAHRLNAGQVNLANIWQLEGNFVRFHAQPIRAKTAAATRAEVEQSVEQSAGVLSFLLCGWPQTERTASSFYKVVLTAQQHHRRHDLDPQRVGAQCLCRTIRQLN